MTMLSPEPDDPTSTGTVEVQPPPEVAVGPDPTNAPFPPAMISRDESEFFTECARGPLPPGGKIVDLGCFMGSTAIALARGLIQSGRRDEVVAYDLFEWAAWMDGNPTYCVYQPGDVFLPEARRYARDHGGGLVTVLRADLSEFEWDGSPISLLLVDAMKSFEVAEQIVITFFPALLPGAVLIHQDFKHYYTGWIHVVQHRFRDACRFIRSVRDGGTVAFTVTRHISADEARAKSDFGTISDEEVEDAFAYSIGLVPPDQMVNVAAAHVMLYHHLGRHDRALARLTQYQNIGLDRYGEFPGMIRDFFSSAHQAAWVA